MSHPRDTHIGSYVAYFYSLLKNERNYFSKIFGERYSNLLGFFAKLKTSFLLHKFGIAGDKNPCFIWNSYGFWMFGKIWICNSAYFSIFFDFWCAPRTPFCSQKVEIHIHINESMLNRSKYEAPNGICALLTLIMILCILFVRSKPILINHKCVTMKVENEKCDWNDEKCWVTTETTTAVMVAESGAYLCTRSDNRFG